MAKIPISLIIDDAGPVNMAYFHDPRGKHELTFPAALARDFAAICRRNGVRGKFTVVPMPGCLGRVDGKLNRVPGKLLRDTLRIIRNEIEPIFSITPEILTHYLAYNLKKDSFHPMLESIYFSKLSASEIADYVAFALNILLNAGLNPTGVTSPWNCGIDNEQHYAEGIGMAFRRVKKADSSFYFLHGDDLNGPVLMCDSKATGRVVSIPETTFDPFYCTLQLSSSRAAQAEVRKNIDRIVSADGRTGIARKLLEAGRPIILISHWQSLYSDGRLIGLEGFEALIRRVNAVFGGEVEWMTFQEITENFLRQTRKTKRNGAEKC